MKSAFEHSTLASLDVRGLQLLHLADSALPIGAMAHSFGLETLAAEADLKADDLPAFFAEWLSGSGRVEAAFCLRAHAVRNAAEWQKLNSELSSYKLARESREASLRLGRRFLAVAAQMMQDARLAYSGAHLATAFGLVSGALEVYAKTAAAACLHQAIYGAISCCQRLMPLGQSAAMRMLWDLKTQIMETVEEASELKMDDLWNRQPILEIGSMRHPQLSTRLFIS